MNWNFTKRLPKGYIVVPSFYFATSTGSSTGRPDDFPRGPRRRGNSGVAIMAIILLAEPGMFQISSPTCSCRPCQRRTWMRWSDPLRVPSSVHFNQPTVQPLPVSQSGGSLIEPCFAADLGFREIHVEARAGNVMAGAGGPAGPAPDALHQPPGDVPPQHPRSWIYARYKG